MSGLTPLPMVRTVGGLSAAATAAKWLTGCDLANVVGQGELATGAGEEGLVVLLSGTFDLQAGPSHWGQRGARTEPTQGRPIGIFLPPSTRLTASGGDGALLLVRARQPIANETPASGRAAFSQKPLLPLAGSGKAFDPMAGEWRPAETFPTAAEILPPRRIERCELPGLVVERVFGADYKAATLCLDEVVIQPGVTFDPRALPVPPHASELLLVVRGIGAKVTIGAASFTLGDDFAAFVGDAAAPFRVQAGTQPCYAVVAWAGKSTPAAR